MDVNKSTVLGDHTVKNILFFLIAFAEVFFLSVVHCHF